MNKPNEPIDPRSQQLFLQALNGLDGDSLGDLGAFPSLNIFGGGSGSEWKTKPILQEGATGADVEDLQTRLAASGIAVTIDKKFGGKTTTAVKQFQLNNGLPDTGIVDSNTWAVLYGEKTSAQKAATQQKTTKTLTDIFSLGTEVVQTVGKKKGKKGGGIATSGASAPMPEEEGMPTWVWVVGGLAVVSVLGGGIYFMTRGSK
jgi:cobalamin biosynthesis Mg chelatase CobN